MDQFLHPKIFRILRFLASGGVAAAVNLGVLYGMTEYLGVWYLVSASLAFIISFAVSFTLQKFWTFGDRRLAGASRQAVLYFCIALSNFFLNIGILYTLVEYAHLHYIFSELIAMVVIACASFFIYRRFVFTVSDEPEEQGKDFFLSFWHALALLIVALIGTLAPFTYTTLQLGAPPELPVALFNDADYYYDRMHEVVDGRPFLGNPYFIEHSGDPPPAFFVADWISAVPLFLGIPLMQTIYLNLFGWSLLFLLLAYALIRAWEGTPLLALFGAILAYSEAYVFILRPVSMQVVFPFFLFFLIGYMLWLKTPEGRAQKIVFGVSAALAACLYTYAWQIIFVVFVLTGCAFLILRRDALKSLILPTILFLGLIAPFVVMTMSQVSHPLYAETLARIGLVKTHLPIFAGFLISLVPLSIGLLALATRPRVRFFEWLREPRVCFFAITGTAIVGVMFSNIVTGVDLELPQHVERFVILWFVFASVYLIPVTYRAFCDSSSTRRALIALFAFLVLAINLQYMRSHGPAIIAYPFDTAQMRDIQKFNAPLTWLRENVKTPSVIWSDPNGIFHHYVAMSTPHYVLFQKGGGLHIVSDREMEDRYLTSHYFSLTKDELIEDYQMYGGTGNAVHLYKTHNRKVRVCRLFQLDRLGYECGELTDMVTFKGRAYFDDLYERFLVEIRPNIDAKLVEYHVGYIVFDNATNSEDFKPEELPHTEKVYDDGRFSIYSLKGGS